MIRHTKQVLLIDRIQDPGNLGTLIRTADAAGLDLIVMEKGTADPFQDKVIRASQGSIFHIPVIFDDINNYIHQFNGPVYGTALENAVSFNDIEAQANFALILGNEGEGVNSDLLKKQRKISLFYLWQKPKVLNVAYCWKYLNVSAERLTFDVIIDYNNE